MLSNNIIKDYEKRKFTGIDNLQKYMLNSVISDSPSNTKNIFLRNLYSKY